jgi:hypothetical protein
MINLLRKATPNIVRYIAEVSKNASDRHFSLADLCRFDKQAIIESSHGIEACIPRKWEIIVVVLVMIVER